MACPVYEEPELLEFVCDGDLKSVKKFVDYGGDADRVGKTCIEHHTTLSLKS